MPTVGWVAEISEFGLAFAPGWAERSATRTVVGAAEARVDQPPGPELADHLVRTPLDDCWVDQRSTATRHLRRLSAARVAALVIPTYEPSTLPTALVEASELHGVPLLTVTPEVSWSRVERAIGAERLREANSRLLELEELLGHARAQGTAERRIERLVAWLAKAVGGPVTLTGGLPGSASIRRLAVAAAPEARVQLAGARATADEVSEGRLSSAAINDGGLSIRLTAVGRSRPYPVLTVGRSTPFDGRTSALVAHAAGLLAPLVQLQEAETGRARLDEVAAGLRVAVFQLLMGGEVTLAQRAAEGLAHGLLDAEVARVYVLEGPADERDQLARECVAATEGQALVVRCPATEQHLIIVAPLREAGAGDAGTGKAGTGKAEADGGDGWDRVGVTLRRFTAGRPDRYLGGSGPLALSQTAASYGDAIRAMAVARLSPDRAALYSLESRLTQVLEPRVASGWAAEALRPLCAVSLANRDQLLGTVQLGLEFPATSAAKILGVSRNTVRARMERAAGLLGLDLSEVRARAVLHLALRAGAADEDLAADEHPGVPGPAAARRPVELAEVLAGDSFRAWADALLRRLDHHGRNLRETLLAWLTVNVGVEQAAQRLGLHPQTVRDHLRGAERLLQRQLLTGGGGVYEVVLAFAALGELELPQHPAQGGRTVHP